MRGGGELSGSVLAEILGLVHRHTGITMTEKKKTLLQGRLGPRLKELSLVTYDDYVSYLSSHPAETQEFINLVTTNETFFFRTQRVWDYFGGEFLPAWRGKNPARTLRAWSAAASTGEEAYSIAMTCRELQEKIPSFLFQISASDISTEVLAMAEKGIYGGRSMADLKSRFPSLAGKYFQPFDADRGQIRPELRASVRFAPHSLFHPPKSKDCFDIVFLRNVMIYFNDADQNLVLKNMEDALVPGGILVLGESESLSRFKTPFEFQAPLIYRKPSREAA